MTETPSPADRSQPSPSLEEMLQLASSHQDGEITESDRTSQEMAIGTRLAEVHLFQRRMKLISRGLKNAPVKNIPGLLVNLESLSKQTSVPAVVISVADFPATTPSPRRKFAGVVSMLVMAGCLLVAVLTSSSEYSGLPRVTASRKTQLAAEIASADFPSNDSWNVVVVQMHDRDRSRAMKKVQSVVRSHGFEFARSAGEEMPKWLGVVLSANESESRALINDIRKSVAEGSVEHDPLRVAESSREELIAAVRESLRYPTQSELHHGKVYLALPDLDRLASGNVTIAKVEHALSSEPTQDVAEVFTARGNEVAVVGSEAASRETDASRKMINAGAFDAGSANRTGVVLVVFQFDPASPPDLKI